jgi:hypothetical protein
VFDLLPVHVIFVVDSVALGQVFLQVLKFFPGSIIPSMLHAHLHLHATVIRRTSKQSLGTFKERHACLVIRQHLTKKYFHSDLCFEGVGHRQTFSLSSCICNG